MDKGKRILIFIILTIILFAIFAFWNGQILPSNSIGLVIFISLIMLSFLTLLVEHLFSKPSDVIASSISILLLIIPLKDSLLNWGILYNCFVIYNFLMIITAITSLYLVDKDKPENGTQNRIAFLLKDFSTRFGSGKFLYFTLFLFTLIYYIEAKSTIFLILLIYALMILLIEPQSGVAKYLKLFQDTSLKHKNELGNIFSVQSKNTFLAKVHKNVAFNEFEIIEFCYVNNGVKATYKGLIFQKYFLDEQQWVKVLQLEQTSERKELSPNKLYSTEDKEFKPNFVGIVDEFSTIHKIKFIYSSNMEINEGTLLQINQGEKNILYQIVDAVTQIEKLESKNEAGNIIGEAIQIGIWNNEKKMFEKYGWVPEVNTPIFLAENIDPVTIDRTDFIIGQIPNTNFPVILNKELAVTHHLGVFGATGCGKSVFTRNLIRQIIDDGTKVICVDFTNEYMDKFSDLNPINLISEEQENTIFEALDYIGSEMDKFPNQRDKDKMAEKSESIDSLLYDNLETYFKGGGKMCILTLPDVSNTSGVIEYTKRFFKVAFQIAKSERNFGKRVCVVIEEAHTVIPEFTFSGIDDKVSKPLVNTISQIALQGRKYDIGFIIIAQRTANVSKSVITQCNSIIAFKQFDNTSRDFLFNYMGHQFSNTLPNLKFRQAIACGKAFKSDIPLIFEVPELQG